MGLLFGIRRITSGPANSGSEPGGDSPQSSADVTLNADPPNGAASGGGAGDAPEAESALTGEPVEQNADISPVGAADNGTTGPAGPPDVLGAEAIERKLGEILREHENQGASLDTSVYKRISDNTWQCVRVLVVALSGIAAQRDTSDQCKSIQTQLAESQQLDEAPYYSNLIAANASLLARASLLLSALHKGNANAVALEAIERQMASIRSPSVEATCDATFLSAEAFLAASLPHDSTPPDMLGWGEMARSIKTEKHKDQHIIRKTESAHRLLCDVLSRCVRLRVRSGTHVATVNRIERERDATVASATDVYGRIAALTDAEVALLIIWVRTLDN